MTLSPLLSAAIQKPGTTTLFSLSIVLLTRPQSAGFSGALVKKLLISVYTKEVFV
jgi:hypothetical protein